MIRLRSMDGSTVSRRGLSWSGSSSSMTSTGYWWRSGGVITTGYVAVQLDVPDPSVVKPYTDREKTAYEHAWEIRDGYGYRDFAGPVAQE
jgi:Domain of unknown function (DUF4158)